MTTLFTILIGGPSTVAATDFIFLHHTHFWSFTLFAQNSRYVQHLPDMGNVWWWIIASVLTFVSKALEILMGKDPCGSHPEEANKEQIILV